MCLFLSSHGFGKTCNFVVIRINLNFTLNLRYMTESNKMSAAKSQHGTQCSDMCSYNQKIKRHILKNIEAHLHEYVTVFCELCTVQLLSH